MQDAGEFVQARIGPAPASTLLDCYQELLRLCTEHHIGRALVVSEDADATTCAALAEALQAMAGARAAPEFKLAILASSQRSFDIYRSAERLAGDNGIAARAFRSRAEAVQWLTGRLAGEPRPPRP